MSATAIEALAQDKRDFLEMLAEAFGGSEELSEVLDASTMRELLLFGGRVAIVRPWAAKLDLRNHGFVGGSYRVFDAHWHFLYEVWPTDGCYGTDERDINYLLTCRNGSLLRVFYEGSQDVYGVLLLCQNKLPTPTERYWIKVWDEANRVALWRPDDHELLFKTHLLPELGYLRIHYLPGRFNEPKEVSDFYFIEDEQELGLKDEVEFLDVPVQLVANWYPKRSGWYLIRHQYAVLHTYRYCASTETGINWQACSRDPFPGSVPVIAKTTVCKDLSCKNELEYERGATRFVRNAAVRMLELTGVGVRRIRYHKDGIFYLDLSGVNLTPAFPASNLYGVGSPQHALDTSSWTRLETVLAYVIAGSSTDQDETAGTLNLRDWFVLVDEELCQANFSVYGLLLDQEELDAFVLLAKLTDEDLTELYGPVDAEAIDEETVFTATLPVTPEVEPDEEELQTTLNFPGLTEDAEDETYASVLSVEENTEEDETQGTITIQTEDAEDEDETEGNNIPTGDNDDENDITEGAYTPTGLVEDEDEAEVAMQS